MGLLEKACERKKRNEAKERAAKNVNQAKALQVRLWKNKVAKKTADQTQGS